ncbi:protein of unknown function [Rhodovastum atsumiense]|nr:protein of unknown function [Rhodovastum atsumiense]
MLTLPAGKPVTRAAQLKRTVGALIRQLPRYDCFVQTLPPHSDADLGFALNGMASVRRFTFQIAADVSKEDAWKGMDPRIRSRVRVAGNRYDVSIHSDADRFISLLRSQYAKRKGPDKNDYEALARILGSALPRQQAAIISATGDGGKDAAAVAAVWDDAVLYLWVTARDPDVSDSSALSSVIWRAVELSRDRRLSMDFDGFHAAENGAFLARFGGMPVVRPTVISRSLLGSALYLCRDLGRAAFFRQGGQIGGREEIG